MVDHIRVLNGSAALGHRFAGGKQAVAHRSGLLIGESHGIEYFMQKHVRGRGKAQEQFPSGVAFVHRLSPANRATLPSLITESTDRPEGVATA